MGAERIGSEIGGLAERRAETRPREHQVEPRRQLDSEHDVVPRGAYQRRQLPQHPGDLPLLLQRQLAPLVAELDRLQRLDVQRRARVRRVVHDARHAVPEVPLDLQHQPVAAHRHDVVLQGLLADRRLYELLQRAGHPPVGVAKLPPDLSERRRRLVEHLASRPDAGLDPAAYHAQVGHVFRHSRQPRRRRLRCAEGRTRALQHLHRLGDCENVRARKDAFERRAFDQRRGVFHGVQADVGPVSQERQPLARLGLQGVDLPRRVGRAQIEGPAARQVETRVPGDALTHGPEVERLHRLRPQPLAAAGAQRTLSILRSLCHDAVPPTNRFYQQATGSRPSPLPAAGPTAGEG